MTSTDAPLSPAATTTPPPDGGWLISEALPFWVEQGYTIPEGVNYDAIWKAIAAGHVPARRVGKRYRLDERGLAAIKTRFRLIPPAVTRARRPARVERAAA